MTHEAVTLDPGALRALAWPVERLGEAVELVARRGGLAPRAAPAPVAPAALLDAPNPVDDGASGRLTAPYAPNPVDNQDALDAWLAQAAAHIGVEADPIAASYADAPDVVSSAGPAILQIRGEGGPYLIAVARRAGKRVEVVRPDLRVERVRPDRLAEALRGPLAATLLPEIERILDAAGIRGARRVRARRALLHERLGAYPIGTLWFLRLPPGASVRAQAARAGLPRRALTLVLAHAAGYGVWLLAFWILGRGALLGRIDQGWLLAWALLLMTAVPLRMLAAREEGLFAIGAGQLLKRRLLTGALALAPEEIRHEGAGALLGRVLESQAVEALSLGGGLLALVAGIELLAAAAILAAGASGLLLTALLAGWVGLGLVLGRQYLRQRGAWTGSRLTMTHDLVECMVGYRTRLAQQRRTQWHDGEDLALERYLDHSLARDRSEARLTALVPRGWLVLGMIGVAPSFVAGTASTGSLAASIAGVLLAYRALRTLCAGLSNLAGAAIAWRQVAPLFHAAGRAEPPAPPRLPTAPEPGRPLIEAREIMFRHPGRAEPVLRAVSLRIAPGDRILLEGASGSGKSTLGALLAGLRVAESGLLLLGGLDRHALGLEGWRRQVVVAPQFQDNHVLTGTFAFNLLMGRRWPPGPGDLEEAEAVCRALDLGGLLDRMPSGLQQMVGETGWQLSHGEKSRLFIARALLQRRALLVLDESFAALDPETLRVALGCVLERAGSLLVIAHP